MVTGVVECAKLCGCICVGIKDSKQSTIVSRRSRVKSVVFVVEKESVMMMEEEKELLLSYCWP